MRPDLGYRRYFYWVSSRESREFLKKFESDPESDLHIARNYPCEGLYPSRPLTIVEPDIWSRSCKRQGSWYRNSDCRGMHLIIAEHSLEELSAYRKGRISVTELDPIEPPTEEELRALVAEREYRESEPEDWTRTTEDDERSFRRFRKITGVNRSLREMMLRHSANHANFILSRPRYYKREGKKRIPLSIVSQLETCSACHELFGILGAHHSRKYVAKCPGLKYVDLRPGEFFIVELGSD